jgi:hypothetical protein
LEIQTKEAQAEEANPEPKQGNPQCITPQSLNFFFEFYLYVEIDCALG